MGEERGGAFNYMALSLGYVDLYISGEHWMISYWLDIWWGDFSWARRRSHRIGVEV